MMFSDTATNNEEDAAAFPAGEDRNNDAAGAAALSSDENPTVGNDDVEGGDPSSDSFLDTASSVPAIAGIPVDNNNSDGPDTNVEGWFNRHALPVTEGVRISLDDWGVACVEQLKLLPSDVFIGMFDSEKLVVRETAKIAFEKLKEDGPVDLSKCVVAQVSSASAKFRNKKRPASDSNSSPKKSQRNTKLMMEARQTEGEDPDPLINGIVRLWSTTGHQNNLLRITVCNALRAGCTKAKIARAVRTRVFGEWDGVGKSDMTYKKIKSTLLRIHNDLRNGKFDGLNDAQNSEEYQKALSSKSVKPGARGRKEGMKMQQARSADKSDDDLTANEDDNLTTPSLPELNGVDL